MGPNDYLGCIDLLVSILPNELSIFLLVKAFGQKHLYKLIFFVHTEILTCLLFFFKVAFILIELHLFEAFSIGNYTLFTRWLENLGSESKGGLKNILKRDMLLMHVCKNGGYLL